MPSGGVGVSSGVIAFAPCQGGSAACSLDSAVKPRGTPAAVREARRNHSRRESLRLLTRYSDRHIHRGPVGAVAGLSTPSSAILQNLAYGGKPESSSS